MSKAKKITIVRDTILNGKKVKRGQVVTTEDVYLLRTGAALEGEVKLATPKGKSDGKAKA